MVALGNIKRIDWLKIIITLSFFAGIIVAHHLWVADRLYPLDPLLPIFSYVPVWADYVLTPLLLVSLLLVAISRKPKRYIVATLTLTAFLFLEDRGRLFPSFYEYFLLLFVLMFYFFQESAGQHKEKAKEENDATAKAILGVCRLAIVFVYFWSGAQKINPFFETQMFWVMQPLLNVAPFLAGRFISIAAIVAPFIEIEIGIGLLFKKTRAWALGEAIFMHAVLFVLIGPFFRSDWNAGAWAWNVASACIVFVLFFQFQTSKGVVDGTNNPSAIEIFLAKGSGGHKANRLAWAVVLIFFGILPALNFVNLWYSGLSFNVFGGNIAQAQIYVDAGTAAKFPPAIQNYIEIIGVGENAIHSINISRWSEDELRAEPYPEPGVYKNIARSLCAYAAGPSDVQITIYDKLTISQLGDWAGDRVGTREQYDCATLSRL